MGVLRLRGGFDTDWGVGDPLAPQKLPERRDYGGRELLEPQPKTLDYETLDPVTTQARLKEAGLPLGTFADLGKFRKRVRFGTEEMDQKDKERKAQATAFMSRVEEELYGDQEKKEKESIAAYEQYFQEHLGGQEETMERNRDLIPGEEGYSEDPNKLPGGIKGRAINVGTPEEKILKSIPPPDLSATELELWEARNPTPKATPLQGLLLQLRDYDEKKRKEKLREKIDTRARSWLHDVKDNKTSLSEFWKDMMDERRGGDGGNGTNITQNYDPDEDNCIYVRFITSLGNFDAQLFVNDTPATSYFFATMCNAGFYNGLYFHRKVHNWIIQGGDPLGTGEGGQVRSLRFPNEVQPALRHTGAGIIGMAMDDPTRPNTQFYITLGPTPPLDGKYVIIGRISNGIEAVGNMNRLVVDKDDRPQQFAMIYEAYVVKGEHHLAKIPTTYTLEAENEDKSTSEDFEVKQLRAQAEIRGGKKKKSRGKKHKTTVRDEAISFLGKGLVESSLDAQSSNPEVEGASMPQLLNSQTSPSIPRPKHELRIIQSALAKYPMVLPGTEEHDKSRSMVENEVAKADEDESVYPGHLLKDIGIVA